MMHRVPACTAALAALALAACGNADTTQTAAPGAEPGVEQSVSAAADAVPRYTDVADIDPCQLIDVAVIGDTIGIPVVVGQSEDRQGTYPSKGCPWYDEAEENIALFVEVSVWPSAERLSGYLANAIGGEPIEGGAEEARWVSGSLLIARQDNVQINTRVGQAYRPEAEEEALAASRRIANHVAGNL